MEVKEGGHHSSGSGSIGSCVKEYQELVGEIRSCCQSGAYSEDGIAGDCKYN